MMWVSVSKLIKLNNPLVNPPWKDLSEPISNEEIANFIEEKRIQQPDVYMILNGESKQDHVNRIAWYVVHGWGDSFITINFKYGQSFSPAWIIYDGNHRLAAASLRGDDMIWSDVYGSRKEIRTLYEDLDLNPKAD